MKCPICESEKCRYITTTETKNKLYNAGDGCCGLLLLGPWGLLCGLCGAESTSKTKEYWICENCGHKFQGTAKKTMEESEAVVKNFEARFVKDVLVESALAEKDYWQNIKNGYYEHVRGTTLDEYYLESMPAQVNSVFQTVAKNCTKSLKKDVKIYCAFIEREGLFIIEEGVFIKDVLIRRNALSSIVLNNNVVYFNQTAFALNSKEEANSLYNFMLMLFPSATAKEASSYEDTLNVLKEKEGSHLDDSHYTKTEEYRSYISKLRHDYVKYYNALNSPSAYNKYMVLRAERKKKNQISMIVQIILFIVLLCNIGLASVIVSVIIALVLSHMDKKKWEQNKKLIPEEFQKLIDEDDYHLGDVDIEECNKSIKIMKERFEELNSKTE